MREQAIQEFQKLLQENLRNVDMIVRTAEKLGVTNEQFYIDYEIKLSELSTKDHNMPS